MKRTILAALAVLSVLALVAVSLGSWRSPVNAQNNNQKLIKREKPGPGEPIVITKIQVGGSEVKFDKPFDGADDWYKSLGLTVENRSNKPINFVEIRLVFLRGDQPPLAWPIYYGSVDLDWRPITSNDIASGDSAQILIVGPDRLSQSLSTVGYSEVTTIRVQVARVGWADGSMWDHGNISSKSGRVQQ